MSTNEKNYDGNPAPKFSNHSEQSHNHFTQSSSPTFTPDEHAKTTTLPTLPPFSSMMATSYPTSEPYSKDAPFTEPRHQVPSQTQPYGSSLDEVSANMTEKQFYRSAVRSSDLPNPLPVPPYSQELLNAREVGRAVEYRSMVIRETVKYFLKMKYWWTSEDYDAMAQMVAREFPDLRDPNVAPGQPDYVRIRAHLSQTARNLRRVAKNQQHRKLGGKPDTTVSTTTSHPGTSADVQQETVPSPAVHSLKQDLSSNRMALPSVAHILSKQYLSPPPMSYPISSASLLPQMMSAGSILASPAYQKYLHSSLLQMSPEGMSSLSQKLLSQLATGSYASLPAFGHNPGFSYPVKFEHEPGLKNDYGALSSSYSSRADDQGEEVQQHLPDRESLSPVSSVGSPRDRDYQDGEDLPVHFGSEHNLTHKSSDSQRDTSPITHHIGSFSPVGSHPQSAKEARKRARSNSECEDDVKPHLGVSEEAELPNPLPVPRYSERVLSANDMGMTKDMRSTIIRETTTFFLNIKYRWTSSDYDRISYMVVSLFPALRDPITSPGYAPTRRVRSDLSMCARNIRRRDVNKITTGYARKKSRAATTSFVYDPKPSVNVKTEPVFSQYSDLSHKAWEQTPPVHDLHGQTFENTALTDTEYGLTAREIARQNLMMMANSADHIQTSMYRQNEEGAAGSSDLSADKASESSEAREAGEISTGQKSGADMSVPVDATVSRRLYFTNGSPRNESVTTGKGAYDQSSYKGLSQESEDVSVKSHNKESRVIESEVNYNHVADTQATVQNPALVPQSAFGCGPGTGHMNNVTSYIGFAANDPINLSSTSDTANSSDGRNSAVDNSSHVSYGYNKIVSGPDATTLGSAASARSGEMACDGDLVSAGRMSSYESSLSTAAYFSQVMKNSATSHNLESGHYVNHESATKSTSADQTEHSIQRKSTAGCSLDVQDDSNCELMFTPLSVEDLRTNFDAEGHKPRTTYPAQISSSREQTLAATDHSGFLAETNSGHPYQQTAVGLTASSKLHQPVPGTTLPDPLPVPTYSMDILKHQQLGQVLDVKQQVIKETVSFYLQWKSSKWTSAEYSRVVKMILQQFPEFRAVKMLKSMVFFTVRNISNRRQFFQTSRFWSKKNKRLQNRPKIPTNPNQTVGSKTKTTNSDHEAMDSQQKQLTEQHTSGLSTADDSTYNLLHHINPDMTKTLDMEEFSGPSSHSSEAPNKAAPDKLRSSLTRQIALPNPLPVPQYSEQLLQPELDYTLKHYRLQIIRETVKHLLLVKYWWSSRDYERIAEMVVTQFPRLADHDSQSGGPVYKKVRRELSMCARNLRRRFVWWDKQSNLGDDVKDPSIVHQLKTEPVQDQEREIIPNANKERGITGVDSATETGFRPSGYASPKNPQREKEDCGYRRKLSALDHHGGFSGVLPNAVKMKKTYVNPDHGNMLQTELSQLWKEGKYFDADLEVNGNKIPTHKLILLAMCPFLQSTLDHTDTKHRIEISMPENSTPEAVDAFLKYLYDGVIHINTDTVHALCKIADMMHIHRLYKHCQDFIESWKKEQQLQEDELNVYRLSLRGQDSDSSQSLNHYHQSETNLHSSRSDRVTGQDPQHDFQEGMKFHSSLSERYPEESTTITDESSSQGLNHSYQVTTTSSVKSERGPSSSDAGCDVTVRQQYLSHQSSQNVDSLCDKTKVQRNTGSSSLSTSQRELQHRDVSLKVDRRVSEKIADTYSRWTSGSGYLESQSEQLVKQERSGSSSSLPLQHSSAHYKQDRSESANNCVPLNNSSVLYKQDRSEYANSSLPLNNSSSHHKQESSSSSVPLQNSSAYNKQEVDSGLQQSVFPQWWPTKM